MSSTVEHLIHVICVPFRIRDKDNKRVYLQRTAKILEGTKWQRVGNDIHPKDVFDDANVHARADTAKLRKYETAWAALQQYQARSYFHPFVQRFLYDAERVTHYARDDIKTLQVDFVGDDTKAFDADYLGDEIRTTFVLQVKRCELVLFQPDIGVLLLEVSPSVPTSLKDTQRLMDSLRRLYPPYLDQVWKEKKPANGEEGKREPTNQWKGGHCPAEVRLLDEDNAIVGHPGVYASPPSPDTNKPLAFFEPYAKAFEKPISKQPMHFPWAAHWRTLLAPFKTADEGEGDLSAHQFGDDRAATMSYLAVDNPRDISKGDWMRLCFADAPGNDRLPYAKQFMSEFEQTYCYDRYWYAGGKYDSHDAPSRILNCGYAFSYVGQANDGYFFANQTNGALPTFRHIYVTMGLIAHFQRAALLAASERLTVLVKRNKTGDEIIIPDRDEVRDFYDQFVEFTQNFWFDEISPQIQGQELFGIWRKHLRIQELYDEVHQELKDLVAYAELRAADKLNQTVSYFGAAAIVLAVVSAIAGIFGLGESGLEHLKSWTTFATWWPKALLWSAPSHITSISIPLLLVSVLTFVALILVMGFKRWKNPIRNFLKGQP